MTNQSSPAVSALDLDAIRARAERAADAGPDLIPRVGWLRDVCDSSEDVPVLLAALAAAHAETEQTRNTLLRQVVEAVEGYDQMRAEHDEARAALVALREANVSAADIAAASENSLDYREGFAAGVSALAQALDRALAAAPSETEEGR